jgi:glycosyltransferase involved in cell wall biosynthesis
MDFSVVIPIYNEIETLPLLHQSIHQALAECPNWTWEVVMVDDGSSDGSAEFLEQLVANDPDHISVIELRRNFGQTAAIAAGIDHALGEIIVLMDADMQNDPTDIPALVEKIHQGYDVVSGWRINRKDQLLSRRLPSWIANWLISTVTGVHLHDYGCTLKAYRREVITDFRLYGEMHRFIPAYANAVGAKIIELPVTHHPRRFGRTKYNLTRTLKVILDLLTVKFLIGFAHKPIYLFGGAGMLLITLSLVAYLFLMVRKFTAGIDILPSPLFQMSTMLMIMGFQSILMGLIAELLARTYHESQHKPTYTIRKVLKKSAGR